MALSVGMVNSFTIPPNHNCYQTSANTGYGKHPVFPLLAVGDDESSSPIVTPGDSVIPDKPDVPAVKCPNCNKCDGTGRYVSSFFIYVYVLYFMSCHLSAEKTYTHTHTTSI